jgi:hypothetical protein
MIRHGSHRKRRVQKFFYCYICIHCRGNVFTQSFSSNDMRNAHTDTHTHSLQGDLLNSVLFTQNGGRRLKVDLKKLYWKPWTGLIGLKIRNTSGPFWTRQWTYGFHNMMEISWVTENLLPSQVYGSMKLSSTPDGGRGHVFATTYISSLDPTQPRIF